MGSMQDATGRRTSPLMSSNPSESPSFSGPASAPAGAAAGPAPPGAAVSAAAPGSAAGAPPAIVSGSPSSATYLQR